MKIITFVTQKGGSGKTTLAINTAVAASSKKSKVLLIDMDKQGTAESWYQDREIETPHLIKIESNEINKAINLAKAQKFDYVFIDTPGRDEPAQATAIRLADFCVVPCRPSPADMKATPATVETIRRLGKSAFFILTQTPPRSFRIREAAKGLSMLGTVCPTHIVSRMVYQDSQGAGMGVIEFEPEGKGSQEIKKVWQWMKNKMEKINYGKEKNVT